MEDEMSSDIYLLKEEREKKLRKKQYLKRQRLKISLYW